MEREKIAQEQFRLKREKEEKEKREREEREVKSTILLIQPPLTTPSLSPSV